ncbi:DNA-binding FadR family transcriptional regulator [Peribacillus deserti]|uniref:DNA-binding FadR family transcriptional regulator n=1 Tax=Peribacillus deserti TaxID=673318 RepID=A0ABS2QHD7_9BACI|nr:GntR family transcriptional regulator [Peribacillus deserti]MBM7691691.1 DNA-binding FadR family transcriptional regulator [Peribacillus deserti]
MDKTYHLRSVPRMFEEVTRSIISYIHDENLEKGDKLPPERELSELLGVSRSSVREGLRILELLKYLDSRQGGGTFVSKPAPFLIPYRLISQSVELSTMQKYFEMALLNAKQIILLSLEEKTSVNLQQSNSNDTWKEFSAWINELGTQLSNDFYLSLWNNIYPLLVEKDYFSHIKADFEINELKIAFYKKDRQTLLAFLDSFILNCSNE